jgi:hypothetical protein
MFVQVIKGKVRDASAVPRRNAVWRSELMPGAKGFLGSTIGVADDGTFFALARFADEAAARANSDRPEQGAWWAETAKVFDGEPTFRESSDVVTLFGGGADNSRFVQVMEGRANDRAKAEALETPEMLEQLRAARPDLLGSVRVWFDDGSWVEAAYFTNEEDARKGESSDGGGPPEEYVSLFGPTTFTDLRDPLLVSP